MPLISRSYAAILAMTICLFSWAAPAKAEITSVMLFPGNARVSEKAAISLAPDAAGNATATFRLPLSADPATVQVSLASSGAKRDIIAIAHQRVKGADPAQAAALRDKLDQLLAEANAIGAEVAAAQGGIKFWSTVSLPSEANPADASALAGKVGEGLSSLHVAKFKAAKRLEEKQREVDEARRRLEEATGDSRDQWEVAVTLTGAASGSAVLTYDYLMGGCGWQPVYRVEARPRTKGVVIRFDAMLWQSSGQDWNAPVSLATLPPRPVLTPPRLMDWIIGPRPPARPMAAKMARNQSADMVMEAQSFMAEAPAPVKERRATYAVYDLGRRSLAAGPAQRMDISTMTAEADFTYLLRPAVSEQAFLKAEIKLAEAQDMPSGEALFLVDGAVLATRSFSLEGRKKEIFFGNDPEVRTETTLLEKQSGEKGFISSKQTYSWKWKIKLINDKEYDVGVTVEEPRPQVRDERIELRITAQPKAEPQSEDKDKAGLMIWKLDLDAASSEDITWGVELTAPEDLDLDVGWR